MKWISVKDQPCPFDQYVLMLDKNQEVRMGAFILTEYLGEELWPDFKDFSNGPCDCCRSTPLYENITHWMPLPEMPNEMD